MPNQDKKNLPSRKQVNFHQRIDLVPNIRSSKPTLSARVDDHAPPRVIQNIHKENYINKLPSRALFQIFMFYLHEEDPDHNPANFNHFKRKAALTSTLTSSARPFTLMGVSRMWRELAQMPPLWSSLAVYKPRIEQALTINQWLERSEQEQLSLYLYSPEGDLEACSDKERQSLKHGFYYIFNLFLHPRASQRLKHITLKIGFEIPFDFLIPKLGMWNLRSVELDLKEDSMGSSTRLWESFYEQRPRQLMWRPATLDRLPPSMPWEYFTHLELNLSLAPEAKRNSLSRMIMTVLVYCENLIDLKLGIPPMSPILDPFENNDRTYSLQEYAEGLEAVRQERSAFRLMNPGQPMTAYELSTEGTVSLRAALSAPIELPKLQRLYIQSFEVDASCLLDRLVLPKLISLQVACYEGTSREEGIPPPLSTDHGIPSFLERSQARLTSLYIFDPAMSKRHSTEIVSSPYLNELEILELVVRVVGEGVVTALTHANPNANADGAPYRMPNLRRLVFSNCNAGSGALSTMVKSRLPTLKEMRVSLAGNTLKHAMVGSAYSPMQVMSKEQYQELSALVRDGDGDFCLTID